MKEFAVAILPVLEGSRRLWNSYAPPPTTLGLIVLVVGVIGVVSAFFVDNPLAMLGFGLLTVFACYSFWNFYCAEKIAVLIGKTDKVQELFVSILLGQDGAEKVVQKVSELNEGLKGTLSSCTHLTGQIPALIHSLNNTVPGGSPEYNKIISRIESLSEKIENCSSASKKKNVKTGWNWWSF